jgi:hypothetical protein
MNLKKSLPIPLLVVGALLVLASTVLAVGDRGTPEGIDAPRVDSIQPETSASLSVFAEQRTAVDAIPGELAGKLRERAEFGMNPDLSRLSIGNATHSVYLVPAQDRVCTVLTAGEGASLTCARVEDIVRGDSGPATVGFPGGDVAVHGIVPDGVGSVAVTTAVGDHSVAVKDNAYYTVLPAGTPVRSVRFTTPAGGPQEIEIVDPRRAMEAAG